MGESLKQVFVHLIKPNEPKIFLLWLFLLKPIKVMSQVDYYNQNSVFVTQVKVWGGGVLVFCCFGAFTHGVESSNISNVSIHTVLF